MTKNVGNQWIRKVELLQFEKHPLPTIDKMKASNAKADTKNARKHEEFDKENGNATTYWYRT